MPDVNLLAILVAAIVTFVIGFTYYSVFAAELAEVSDAGAAGEQPPAWKMAVEFSRGLILATVVALGLAGRDRGVDRRPAAGPGSVDRVPVRALDGAMIWENTPWKLAAVHAGDWLVKLLAVGVIVTA